MNMFEHLNLNEQKEMAGSLSSEKTYTLILTSL